MRTWIMVRPLTDAERSRLEAGLHSPDAFVLGRCPILLASARGSWPPQIAQALGCNDQTVRTVIRCFERDGLEACLTRKRPERLPVQTKLDAAAARLRALLHRGPRELGHSTSLWTLALAAEVSCAEGLSRERVSDETSRRALNRLGVGWTRAHN